MRTKSRVLLMLMLAGLMVVMLATVAEASTVSCSTDELSAWPSSTSLEPGSTTPIIIDITIIGPQSGNATFNVYTTWTLTKNGWVGSNSQPFSVKPSSYHWYTIEAQGNIVIEDTGYFVNGKKYTVELGASGIDNDSNVIPLRPGDYRDYSIKISDTRAPQITAPADVTATATGNRTSVIIVNATSTDQNVNFSWSAPGDSQASSKGFLTGITEVVWKATDINNNPSYASQWITVNPTIIAPVDKTVEATADPMPVALGTPTCYPSSGATVTNDAPATAKFPYGPTTVIWTITKNATDKNGNPVQLKGIDTQLVTITDKTVPSFKTLPKPITKEATAPQTPVDLGTVEATDLYGIQSLTNNAPAAFEVGDTTVTWTAVDIHGNTKTANQIVTITDKTSPVITVPANITVEATGNPTTPQSVVLPLIGKATATDLVGVTEITNNAPANFPLGQTTVTWTAKDKAGNSISGDQVVTLADTTAPVIDAPDLTVEATSVVGTPVTDFGVKATDLFKVELTSDAPALFPYGGPTVVNWTAIDINSNVGTAKQNVYVVDKTKPIFTTPPADVEQEATGVLTAIDLGIVEASDIFKVNLSNDAPAAFPVGITTVTWTATDEHGNSVTAIQNVKIKDTTPPELSVPADGTVEATAVNTPQADVFKALGVATATDIATAPANILITNDAPDTFPLGLTVVKWTADDTHGNTVTATQKVTVVDTTVPVITAPANVKVEATAVNTPIADVVLGTATATDIATATTDIVITNDAPAVFPLGDTIVTWTAVDKSGNKATAQQTVTIVDTTTPSITAPADVTVEATAVNTPQADVALGMATATDIATATADILITNDAPVTYPLGDTTVTWTAVDNSGNKATATQKVTITDTTDPVMNAPADGTVEATAVNTPKADVFKALGAATATDIATATADILITNDAPDTFPLGLTVVTWTADDTHGNTVTATQKVTVVDTTVPVITAPANVKVEATAVNTPIADVVLGTATATDIATATTDIVITNDAPAVFPLGDTIVTWTSVDKSGNKATAQQTVTIVDTTIPSITAPADVTVEATAVNTPQADVALGMATATDIATATADILITNDAPITYPLGDTTVTWTAVDNSGNKATATQKVTITDTTDPVITAPADGTVEATAVKTPKADVFIALGVATATDVATATADILSTNDAPDTFPLGLTAVTWTADDTHGNKVTATQKVTVVDTTKPVITAPKDGTVEATAVDTPQSVVFTALGEATATDIFNVTIKNDAPATFGVGVPITITWTATDENGNFSTATQKVTVIDTTDPTIQAPADVTVEATAVNTPQADVNMGTATGDDIFKPVEITNNAPAAFPLGKTTVVWTATDANGNKNTATQTVTIVDTTDPVITAPKDGTVEATGADTPKDVIFTALGKATATDIFPVNITNDAPDNFLLGVTDVIWTATDANGRDSSATQKVTVVDTTPPVLTVPKDINIGASGAAGTPVTFDVSALDAVDGPVAVTCSHMSGATFPIGKTTVKCTATDAHNNKAEGSFTITVQAPTDSFVGSSNNYSASPASTSTTTVGPSSTEAGPENGIDTITFTLGESKYYINGKSNSMDTASFDSGGRMFVPQRYLGIALGIPNDDDHIKWDEATSTAIFITKSGKEARCTLGSNILLFDGKEIVMDVEPLAEGGRIFLPARFLSEAMGGTATWDDLTKTATILITR